MNPVSLSLSFLNKGWVVQQGEHLQATNERTWANRPDRVYMQLFQLKIHHCPHQTLHIPWAD